MTGQREAEQVEPDDTLIDTECEMCGKPLMASDAMCGVVLCYDCWNGAIDGDYEP
jgi:hypothetical protein